LFIPTKIWTYCQSMIFFLWSTSCIEWFFHSVDGLLQFEVSRRYEFTEVIGDAAPRISWPGGARCCTAALPRPPQLDDPKSSLLQAAGDLAFDAGAMPKLERLELWFESDCCYKSVQLPSFWWQHFLGTRSCVMLLWCLYYCR
jgi:hypothetical protein